MSATELQLRRGNHSAVANFTGAEGEPIYDITEKRLVMSDGSTKGGIALARKDEIAGIATSAANAAVAAAGGSLAWYTSADKRFGYIGTKSGVTCAFGQDTITVTIPTGCWVTYMYICQEVAYITKSKCTITFDKNGVMTGSTATVDVDDLTTLCQIVPWAYVYQIASDGIQDNRSGISQMHIAANAFEVLGLKTGDDRVFVLRF